MTQSATKGRKITDNAGRVGTITEVRDGGCVFAKPDGIPYNVDGEKYVHTTRTIIITATTWYMRDDGLYHGCWFDDPLHTERTATLS